MEFLKGYMCVCLEKEGEGRLFLSSIVELEMFSGATVLLN